MTAAAGARAAQARPPGGPRLPWLRAGAAALGINLSPDQLAAFDHYRDTLLAANRRTNLTAITDPAAVEIRHFVDSLTCLLAWPTVTDRPVQVIDIGAGAGFPGLPLKLIRPHLTLALLDSVGKKTAFLTDLVRRLNLEATTVVTARAEDLARQPAHREQYDVASGTRRSSRARTGGIRPALLAGRRPPHRPENGWQGQRRIGCLLCLPPRA